MIELKNNSLYIDDKRIPKGQIEIIKVLLKENTLSAFKIMELTGKAYVQYTQSLLRILILYGIVLRTEFNSRPAYELNPELIEELRNLL